LLSLAALGAASAYAIASTGRFTGLAVAASVPALALLLAALLLRLPSLLPWAAFFVGVAYLIGRVGQDLVDGWASAVGVLILLAVELGAWSIEHDARIRTQRALVLRRAGTLTALCAAALFVDFILLGTAAVSASAGVLLAAAGVAAAVAAVAMVLRLLRA
jgi:hypothetical protein